MKRTLQTIRQHLPRRRRRFWRYVSPRRRGVGLVVLAVLLGLFYGYWYLTNDARIRRMAEAFLRDTTGGIVSVQSAKFHLFGGIELRGVRIYTPDGSSKMPAMKAPSLILSHDPWKLLATGQLHPTKVICNQPEVNVVFFEVGTNWQLMFNARDEGESDDTPQGPQQAMITPPVQFRGGVLRFFQVVDGVERLSLEWPDTLEITAIPAGENRYKVYFPNGEGLLDLAQGAMIEKDFRFPEGLPLQTLPPKYRELLERYHVAKGSYRMTSLEGDKMLIRPENASMKLPPSQGGLSFTQVSGDIIIDPAAGLVIVRNMTGRIPEAGLARFSINGQYGSEDPQWGIQDPATPCNIVMKLTDAQIPRPEIATQAVGDLLKQIHQLLSPSGRISAEVTVSRQPGGPLQMVGQAKPENMTVTYKDFPYPFTNLTGTIDFDQAGLRGLDLRAMEDRIHLTGNIQNDEKGLGLDLQIQGQNIAFDKTLRDALPENLIWLWDDLKPRGATNIKLVVQKQPAQETPDIELELSLAGKTGVTLSEFPYPMDSMTGRVRLRDKTVTLVGIESREGSRVITINGSITDVGSPDWQLKMLVDADHIPIDKVLLGALGPETRQTIEKLHPTGLIDRAKVHITNKGDAPMDFKVLADIVDVSTMYEGFAYKLTDVAGSLTITPGKTVIESGPQGKGLSGRHNQGQVNLFGQISHGKENQEAVVDLEIDARQLALDEDLRRALPEGVQKVWALLSPAGTTDLHVKVKGPDPSNPKQPFDYNLTLLPTDMSIRFEHFPLSIKGVQGRITAVPGKVDIERMTISDGSRTMQMVGQIKTSEGRQEGELKVIARNLPIDKEFIEAVPGDLLPAVKRLKPQGTCSVDLKQLQFVSTDKPAGPGQKPQSHIRWSTQGEFSVSNAAIDIGMDIKSVSGGFTGKIVSAPAGTELEGTLKLDSVEIGNRKITQLTARLQKAPQGEVLVLRDLAGRAHGGKLAGLAEIRLTKNVEYAVSLVVDRIDLDSLVNAGIKDPKKKTDIKGKMAGRVSLIAKGPMKDWKAEGRIQIANAKIYKLPVFLGLLHVVYLTPPTDSAFTEAQMGYQLQGGKLVFEEIRLNGNAASLLGTGNVDIPTEKLRLTFIAGPPGKMPSIGTVSEELLQIIAKELVVIEVGGTLKNPRYKTVPLKGIRNIINALLAPSRNPG